MPYRYKGFLNLSTVFYEYIYVTERFDSEVTRSMTYAKPQAEHKKYIITITTLEAP